MGPLTMGVQAANPALAMGLKALKSHGKTLLRPVLLTAVKPMAKELQDVFKAADLDTSTSNAALLQIKKSLLGARDDMLRATESRLSCSLLYGELGVSSARKGHVAAALTVSCISLYIH